MTESNNPPPSGSGDSYDTAPPSAPPPPPDTAMLNPTPAPTAEAPASGPLGYISTPPAYEGAPPTKDESNMSMLMFILAIFTGFLGPLILWLVKKNESKFIDAQGKEILNYTITMIMVLLINIPLWFIIIGILIHFAVLIASLVFFIMGAVKASKGQFYRFPVALRLLK